MKRLSQFFKGGMGNIFLTNFFAFLKIPAISIPGCEYRRISYGMVSSVANSEKHLLL